MALSERNIYRGPGCDSRGNPSDLGQGPCHGAPDDDDADRRQQDRHQSKRGECPGRLADARALAKGDYGLELEVQSAK